MLKSPRKEAPLPHIPCFELDEIERRGELRGRREGRARMLRELLSTRFGAVSAKVSARILSADEAVLTTWTARLLSAPTLNDVLGEDGGPTSSTRRAPARSGAKKRARRA